MSTARILIEGHWTRSEGGEKFNAFNPKTGEALEESYSVSPWFEIEKALHSADRAFQEVRTWPGERFAAFLDRYAERIEARKDEIVAMATLETALPVKPRLADAELPRTTNQLRQAAASAREGSWVHATIDTKTNIRSMFEPVGPVVVFGPNNFPFAYNGIAGGDFASAVAAGNPVLAKAHPLHPGTSRLLAEEAQAAADDTHMPAGFVQMIYHAAREDGVKLVSHPLVGGIGYTGGRTAGLFLKEAADRVGKPIYLELSSVNPVFVLKDAMRTRAAEIAAEFTTSCLMAAGQFCTNPGLVIIPAGGSDEFIKDIAARFDQAPVATMLGASVAENFLNGIQTLLSHGAKLITGGEAGGGEGACARHTLLTVTGTQFLANPEGFQTEAFGNGSLIVVAENSQTMLNIARALEGNLTGSIYSAIDGSDDTTYTQLAPILRQKVGRLLNDKMPTGVAVVPSMVHGGPFPATGHAGFTAVGFPASIYRFASLHGYDNVRPERLPIALQDIDPVGRWRFVDHQWTRGMVG